MEIRPGDLDDPGVVDFLREHLDAMGLHSPPESVHTLAPEELRGPDVTFWCVWEDAELLGCGALKELDPGHGEIKSMRTSPTVLRRGVASHLLKHILVEAVRRGYHRLSLETGSAAAFLPARELYARFGFRLCGPFGPYVDDPFSVFMTRELP